ncbi:MAG TPA: hypothetical protein VL527_09320, partial [Dongiaceae bacterium]|nr:hypothetical protein [Dongiaceae bacterium]
MRRRILSLGTLLLLLTAWRIPAATLYVDGGSTNPAPPYLDWASAAADIQSAIDAAQDGDLILVTNGLYATGGRVIHGALTNRVAVDKAVTVQSVNGPDVTLIQGYQAPGYFPNDDTAIRGVYLTNHAALVGFTITGGATRYQGHGDIIQEQCGGGIWCESTNAAISNCVITANTCMYYAAGVYSGTLYSSLVVSNLNRKTSYGGGAVAYSRVFDSVISGNLLGPNSDVGGGGGAFSCTLSNCVLTGNALTAVDHCFLDNCTLTNN